MTTRTVQLLGFALALQLVFIGAAAYLGGGFNRQDETPAKLIPLEADTITGLSIEDGDGNRVTLAKVDGTWRLPDYFDMPVDEHKRSDVLGRLLDAPVTWPVATSGSAAKRFKVADDAFERHVVFETTGGDDVELYLGTSPGFRRVHARVGGSDEIYAVEFSNYQLPARAADWMDKSLVTPSGNVTRISSQGWTLTRAAEGTDGAGKWTLEGLAEGETLDEGAVENLVSAITSLRVEAVASDDEVAALADAEPAFRLSVDTDDGKHWSYTFFSTDSGYVLRTQGQERAFRIAKYTGDRLAVPRDKLLESAQETDAAAEAKPDG